ncbi:MAG: ribonuclease H-like domain-containing protein [Patescibacteria group bacterium]
MNLVFDIETLPAPPEAEPALRELFARRPGRANSFSDFHRGTSLSGNWGRIFCIGIAQDDQPAKVLTGNEADILREFWRVAAQAERVIGHHIIGFDLPFIIKRTTVHDIQMTTNLRPLTAAAGRIFDTKREWDQGDGHTGLDQLAKIFDLPSSKQSMNGAMVYDYYQAGKYEEIYEYCRRDVELTRAIYRRLQPKE